ncbi:phage integrase family protein [Crateriforma spongiae]|uniref:phage integrase family protein n=1 Tax=Crateriforma spongiae TaxID=2724528 RepID=UPI001444CE3B|nr:phage integrase family protein [Crateriforma spongiae]
MATKRILNWRPHDQGGRWRKLYKGKYFQRNKRPDESREESYQRVLAEFEEWKAKVDEAEAANDPSQRAWNLLIENADRILADLEKQDSFDNRRDWKYVRANQIAAKLLRDRGVKCPLSLQEIEADPRGLLECYFPEKAVLDRSDPPWATKPQPTASGTLGAIARTFLKEKKAEADAGQLSFGRYKQLKIKVDQFVSFVGANKKPSELTNGALTNYRIELLDQVASDTLSAKTAKDKLAVAVQFVRWAVSESLIERPAILDSPNRLSITASAGRIQVFDELELQTLYKGANDRTRLFMLLCLNCGMTQVDIGKLRHDEVDWKKGRIARKRSKTAKHGDAIPTVNYPLWKETFRLLKKFRSGHDSLALTNENGNPLWDDRSDVNSIDSVWKRLRTKLAEDGTPIDKPMKLLRKTSSTRLETKYPQFGDLFLGHAAASMKSKHYANYPQDQFDAAVEWLGLELAAAIDG